MYPIHTIHTIHTLYTLYTHYTHYIRFSLLLGIGSRKEVVTAMTAKIAFFLNDSCPLLLKVRDCTHYTHSPHYTHYTHSPNSTPYAHSPHSPHYTHSIPYIIPFILYPSSYSLLPIPFLQGPTIVDRESLVRRCV